MAKSRLIGATAIGAAIGALSVVAARRRRAAPEELLNWDRVLSLACTMAGKSPEYWPEISEAASAYYQRLMEGLLDPISRVTGSVNGIEGARLVVLDREEWIRTNIHNFREMLTPFESLYRSSLLENPVIFPEGLYLASYFLSGQMGLMVGYLSRHVLGQYDMAWLGRDPSLGGSIYFVEPNIINLERRLNLNPRQIRTWIALHEATHAYEFESYPWLRPYLNELLQEFLEISAEELREPASLLRTVAQALARARESFRGGQSLLEAMMSPRQRELVDKIQAAMSLLEGYSNVVMRKVGRTLSVDYQALENALERRRTGRSALENLFLRLTGLSMKLEQYRVGERFIASVADVRGMDFVSKVWTGPETLPMSKELEEPHRWIRRVEGRAESL